MRLFSEEINVGTYEILLTLPVTSRDILYFLSVMFIALYLAVIVLINLLDELGRAARLSYHAGNYYLVTAHSQEKENPGAVL